MAQITTGIRSLLSSPLVYNLWSHFLGAPAARADFIERYLKVKEGDRVLDIGCGTGTMFEALPDTVEYTGFDLSEAYVNRAKSKYGDRATFVHARVGDTPELPLDHFDIVFATGVLHHLDDDEALELFSLAEKTMKVGARLITSDPVYVNDQSRIARYVISRDRGQNVRKLDAYTRLAAQIFTEIETDVRHDRIRIPYTHLILECTKRINAS